MRSSAGIVLAAASMATLSMAFLPRAGPAPRNLVAVGGRRGLGALRMASGGDDAKVGGSQSILLAVGCALSLVDVEASHLSGGRPPGFGPFSSILSP